MKPPGTQAKEIRVKKSKQTQPPVMSPPQKVTANRPQKTDRTSQSVERGSVRTSARASVST